MLDEFKKFALRGNVVDLAIGFVIGSAFALIVKSFVSDLLMPPIGLLLGDVDFSNLFLVLKEGMTPGPYATLALAQEAGAVTLNYGLFVNSVVSFLIVALVLFLVIKGMNELARKEEVSQPQPTTRDCPHCLMAVPVGATRCGHCTSQIGH